MEFTDKILSLINAKGISINRMLKDLGMGAGTFATWQKRGTIPNGDSLKKIANYFEVSMDYLLENEQKNKPAAESSELDPLDAKIMELFSRLNPANKKLALAQIEAIINSQDNE